MTQHKVRRLPSRRRILDPEKLRLARLARGMEQAELAGLVGTSQPEISRYENGKSDCNPKRLKQFADALGRQPEDLMADAA